VLFSLLGGNQKSFSPCSLSIFPCFWIWKEYKEYKDLKRKREFIILLRRDSGKEGTMPVRFFFLPFLFFMVVSSGFVGCGGKKKEGSGTFLVLPVVEFKRSLQVCIIPVE
jgi:cytochrome c biogenesis protein CcdA